MRGRLHAEYAAGVSAMAHAPALDSLSAMPPRPQAGQGCGRLQTCARRPCRRPARAIPPCNVGARGSLGMSLPTRGPAGHPAPAHIAPQAAGRTAGAPAGPLRYSTAPRLGSAVAGRRAGRTVRRDCDMAQATAAPCHFGANRRLCLTPHLRLNARIHPPTTRRLRTPRFRSRAATGRASRTAKHDGPTRFRYSYSNANAIIRACGGFLAQKGRFAPRKRARFGRLAPPYTQSAHTWHGRTVRVHVPLSISQC